MSQQENKTATDANQNNLHFELQKTYIKNSRFNAPQSTELFRPQSEGIALQAQLHVDTKVHKLSNERYEVTLKIAVTALPLKSQTAVYEVEVSQAGLFAISNYREQDFAHILYVSCPSLLFPYARQMLFRLVECGGFPPMVLAPMNFEVMYQQYQERLQKTNQAPMQSGH
jgi:preprotein translocase subunit SecB